MARQENKINIFETNYNPININAIKKIKENKLTSIYFEDDKNEYSFNFSKSTLYRKFYTPGNAMSIDMEYFMILMN